MDKKEANDFNNWNNKKQEKHFKKQRPFFHEQEVWFCETRRFYLNKRKN